MIHDRRATDPGVAAATTEAPQWPDRPLRVRVEWVVAAARVVLAAGALVAVIVDPPAGAAADAAISLLTWYFVCSVGILALVWSPTRFSRGWAKGLHALDLFTFTALMVATDGASSPFFVWLVFLLICAAIRWRVPGTLWTAAGVAVAYTVASVYAAHLYERQEFATNTFIIHGVYLLVVTALLSYLSSYQHQFHDEVSRLAAWPRAMSRVPRAVVADVLGRAGDILGAPRVLVAWDDPETGHLNLALLSEGTLIWAQEPEAAFGSMVLPEFEGRPFQTADARRPSRTVTLAPRGFQRRECLAIDSRLRARFHMVTVQSWPLDGDIVRGRLFCLDKRRLPLDDLLVGEFVARLVTARLDSMYMLERLRGATALEERVRVARDLHDGLLQSQAGAALQLLAARRQLDRDPAAARQRLADVQDQLERVELEMRGFIKGLRPMVAAPEPRSGLRDRFQDLQRRMERQWDVRVSLELAGDLDAVPHDTAEHVYRIVQEGLVNAGRHADASAVRVTLTMEDGVEHDTTAPTVPHGPVASGDGPRRLHLTIADDGKGFPFEGTYDLAALGASRQGPRTLQERVAELRGDLTLTSAPEAGSTLFITLPLAPATHAY
jgi:signal transduction histidine kinase